MWVYEKKLQFPEMCIRDRSNSLLVLKQKIPVLISLMANSSALQSFASTIFSTIPSRLRTIRP